MRTIDRVKKRFVEEGLDSAFDKVRDEVEAWEMSRNGTAKKINWQFTTNKARIKLKRFYPSYDC